MSKARLTFVVMGVMLGMLLGALDQTIVGTAMPRIVASLGGMHLYAWTATAYMLSSTATMPIYGKLSDIYGHKWVYILGLALFMLGSILSGLSQTMIQLIAFRGLQGLGAGAMMPVAMAIIGDIFPPAERAKMQGIMGASFGLASILGPMTGGYITDNLDWRWVFYVNLPVGVVAVAILFLALPAIQRRERHDIDYLGAMTLVVAIVPMLLALVWAGKDYGWLSPQIVGLFVLSTLGAGTFIYTEQSAREPILPLSLFRNSIFSVSAAVVFVTGIGMFGSIMFVPLFVQGVIGASATDSGMITTPMMISVIAASIIGGQAISRTGRYRAIAVAGLFAMCLGLYLLSGMGVESTNDIVLRNMIVTGFGLGVTLPLFTIVVQNAFDPRQIGVVTSSVQFFRSIGGTVGLAVLGTLMANAFRDELPRRLAPVLPDYASSILTSKGAEGVISPQTLFAPGGSGGIEQLPPQLASLAPQITLAVRTALASSLEEVFFVGLLTAALGTLICFFLREIPLRRTRSGPPFGRGAEVGHSQASAGSITGGKSTSVS